ncbi:hypothetical protein B0J18DRAFT_35983 [Chaetomium sp. MPI-SDFR-AT-0129]|nr:hypothetical protein B0J18DRAFT_35983 [Chaetomium sp. MPI-SDFR-AT-0129]
MVSKTFILSLVGVAAAMPGQPQARDALDDLKACTEALATVTSGMPGFPTEVASFYLTQTETDPCKVTPPPAVESKLSSYQAAASSWFNENGEAYSSAISKCPGGDLAIPTPTNLPTTCGGSTGGSSSGGDSSSGSGSGSGSGNGDKPNDATRSTGLVAMAAALAGFVGVVAAL